VYVLVLVGLSERSLVHRLSVLDAVKTRVAAYIFYVQNLFHIALPRPSGKLVIGHRGAVLLSLAPLVRFLRRLDAGRNPDCAFAGSPLLDHHPWLTPTHTLIHLDGIALAACWHWGSTRSRLAAALGSGSALRGDSRFSATATIAGGTRFLDSALASPLPEPCSPHRLDRARNPLNAVLRRGHSPSMAASATALMIHIAVFIYFGWFDAWMNNYGTAGNLAIVAFRLVTTTAVARALVRFRVANPQAQALF